MQDTKAKYRQQVKAFYLWSFFSFVATIILTYFLGIFLSRIDVADLGRNSWILYPNTVSFNEQDVLSGRCGPSDRSCGKWSRLTTLNFGKMKDAGEVLYLVHDGDFGKLLEESRGDRSAENVAKFPPLQQGLVVNFGEAYGLYSGWLDGVFLGDTSRSYATTEKIYPFAGEALPIPVAAIDAGREQRLIVRVGLSPGFKQKAKWEASSFTVRSAAKHVADELGIIFVVGGVVLTIFCLGFYHLFIWFRRRDAGYIGLYLFCLTAAIQQISYFNMLGYFGVSSHVTYVIRFICGYFQPITYLVFCFFFAHPVSLVWQEWRRRRGDESATPSLRDFKKPWRVVVVLAEFWGLIGIPVCWIATLILPPEKSVVILYKIGLPLNLLLMFLLFGYMVRWLTTTARERNISYALPFVAGVSVIMAAVIIGIVTALGVKVFPSFSLAFSALSGALLGAVTLGSAFTQIYREAHSNRERLKTLVDEGRAMASLYEIPAIAAKLGSSFRAICRSQELRVSPYFSPVCFADGATANAGDAGLIPFDSQGSAVADAAAGMDSIERQHDRLIRVTEPRNDELLAVVGVSHEDSILLDRHLSLLDAMSNSVAGAITTVQLEHALKEVNRKRQEVQTIFEIIPQGILCIDERSRILPGYSPYTETILGIGDLASREFAEVVLSRTTLDSASIGEITSRIDAIMGENILVYQINSDLPRELELSVDGRTIWLEVEWAPIPNANEDIERLMVTLHDVTELRKLNEEKEKHAERMILLSQLVSVSLESYYRFMQTSQEYLTASRELIDNPSLDPDPAGVVKRHFHTIKGNARCLGFSIIIQTVHDAETRLGEFSCTWDNPDTRAQIHGLVQEIEDAIQIYRDINDNELHRSEHQDQHRLHAMRLFAIRSHQVVLSNSLPETLGDGLRDSFEDFARNEFPTLERLCERQKDLARKVSEQLGISCPQMLLQAPVDCVFETAHFDALLGAMAHIVSNAIDHGFRPLGPNAPQGFISLTVDMLDDGLSMKIVNSGVGLKMDRLADKGRTLGMFGEGASAAEVLEVMFASGASTSDVVTDISGRGVGMGAARALLRRVGGELRVEVADTVDKDGFSPFWFVITVPREAILFTISMKPSLQGDAGTPRQNGQSLSA